MELADGFTLEQMPLQIFKLRDQISDLRTKMDDREEQLSKLNLRFDQLIADDTSLKNDQQRKTRKRELQESLTVYQELNTELNQMQTVLDFNKNQLQYFMDCFEVMKLAERRTIANIELQAAMGIIVD